MNSNQLYLTSLPMRVVKNVSSQKHAVKLLHIKSPYFFINTLTTMQPLKLKQDTGLCQICQHTGLEFISYQFHLTSQKLYIYAQIPTSCTRLPITLQCNIYTYHQFQSHVARPLTSHYVGSGNVGLLSFMQKLILQTSDFQHYIIV